MVLAGVLATSSSWVRSDPRRTLASDGSGQAHARRRRLQALTAREKEVTLAVAQGLSNAEIGRQLFLSVATIKAYTSTILAKLDLANRTQLAILVHEAGLA